MLKAQTRRRDDPTWVAEYEAVRRELRDSTYEDDRKLLEIHDRVIEMLDRIVEDRRAVQTAHMKKQG
jgi:hypothetical protein